MIACAVISSLNCRAADENPIRSDVPMAKRPTIPQRKTGPGLQLPMRVWDLPIRLFHWCIVVLIATSYLTYRFDRIEWHKLSGMLILTLLLFRLAWGFVGSDTARFTAFLKSPIAGLRHIAAFGRREPDTQVGHNEAGGWMVLALLGLLLFQAVSGLFANDDSTFEAPLFHLVGKATSDSITGWHAFSFKLIEAAIVLHILAIVAYAVVKRHDLVRPMITGKKKLPAATPAPRMRSPLLAAVLLVLSFGIVWAVTTFV
jgi:cytochrome b